MELRRDIYQELIKWKKNDIGKVLEQEGARQTGKTFILDKFLKCLEKATYWEPGMDVMI